MVGVPVANWNAPEALPIKAGHRVFLDKATYQSAGQVQLFTYPIGCTYGGIYENNACYDAPSFIPGRQLKYYAYSPQYLWISCPEQSGSTYVSAYASSCCSYSTATDVLAKVQGSPRHFLRDRSPNVVFSFRPTAPLRPVTGITLVSSDKLYQTCNYVIDYVPPQVSSPLLTIESAWSAGNNPYNWGNWRSPPAGGLTSTLNRYTDPTHGIAANTTWYVKFRVSNAYGTSPESDIFSFTTPEFTAEA